MQVDELLAAQSSSCSRAAFRPENSVRRDTFKTLATSSAVSSPEAISLRACLAISGCHLIGGAEALAVLAGPSPSRRGCGTRACLRAPLAGGCHREIEQHRPIVERDVGDDQHQDANDVERNPHRLRRARGSGRSVPALTLLTYAHFRDMHQEERRDPRSLSRFQIPARALVRPRNGHRRSSSSGRHGRAFG
jgi:hypothetical protein